MLASKTQLHCAQSACACWGLDIESRVSPVDVANVVALFDAAKLFNNCCDGSMLNAVDSC